jgi:hypothetical protein
MEASPASHGERTFFAVTADVAGDETTILRPERWCAEPRARGRARKQILDKDVRPRQHAMQEGGVLRRLYIKSDGLLTSVEPREISAFAVHDLIVPASKVTLGALNFDHPRPSLG